MLDKESRIFIAGHRGMVGSTLLQQLKEQGFSHLIVADREQLDLLNQSAVADFMQKQKPDCVILAAAKVGGIHANNTYPADFIYDNLMIQANIIHQAYAAGVQRLLFLGSSCIYPKFAAQPMKEEELLSGVLEPTNEPYAIAKIAGIKLCESYNRQYQVDYRSVMPTNLYGPGDNFHPDNSHVIPALIRRFHEAKCEQQEQVVVWGTGKVRREFLHVDDMASACLHVMNLPQSVYQQQTEAMLSHINVGMGSDVTIAELAQTVAEVVGFTGRIVYDTDKPDGTPKKLLDITKLKALGWSPKIALKEGLSSSYAWFLEHQDDFRC